MNRLNRFREVLQQHELDAYIIMSPENRRYMSGFTGTAGTLVITREKAHLLTDFRYVEQAMAQAPNFEIIKIDHDRFKIIGDLISSAKRVGFEGDYITFTDYNKLKESLPEKELISNSSLIDNLRSVKDEEEIEILRQAARIADEAFNHILKYIQVGQTEEEIALELEVFMRKLGASGKSFDFIVASGKRSSLPHGVASGKKIEKGEFLTMDFGAVYKGYCSDITRTVFIGEPDEKQREIYDRVLKANQLGIQSVKPGKTGKEIDAVVRNFIADAGYGEHFGHGLGHSVGLAIHEGPSFNVKEERVIEPGMVLTVEPGIYLPDWGGVRIEDMVLVTEDGCKVLTQSPKEFIIIE